MPPSPAMRCSPGREPRADNHKRGRSLESGVPLKQRDDDLALFNEVQNRERDNFLLQGDDDFEDIFANKLRHFSDYKLGINIPARGESSDLLHAEDEKNDYEWLITPPDTPLFPSLDDEAPQVNLTQRGRTRTQPISISRSPTMEKGRRSSRGSASPNRVSLSPRSHNSTYEGRHRASSAASASPPATLRHNTPPAHSHRSPPPSRKPVPRASTPPPPRRLSTGSTNGTTTTTKGIRGNSASPKVKAWQSSIPGFSTEVPPNLRTSLADRPASYVRGSSPASRSSRQSMSPTASRSIGSSHSHERDRFSSHSKGSVGSSAEDDMESLSSVLVVVGRPNSRRVGVGGFQNNKASPSKKPIRTISSSSAPKRSFDLALRQMDHRKGQNMFRPLLSSVPSSTFHAGIATSPYHPVISRNSSVTTSSNASSGVAISGAHDHDHDHDPDHEASQDDATSGYVKVQDDDDHDVDVDDEVFMIEKDDGNDSFLDNSRNILDRDPAATLTIIDDVSDISTQKEMLICSKCGCGYSPPIGQVENDTNLCENCMESNSSLTIIDPVVVSGPEPELTTIEPQMDVVESLQAMANDLVKDSQSEGNQVNVGSVDFSNSKVESLEGAGISILLKRSSSIKGGAVVRNTNFSASSISYDDFSYVRGDTTNSMRSVSATSSVDFGQGQSRQLDTRFQRQSSITKSEIEHSKHQRSGSSLSGTSSHVFHPSSLGTSTLDSSGKDVQENNEVENENVDSGESLLTNTLKDEEESVGFQKAEDLGADDTALDSCNDDADVAEAPLDVILEGELDSPSKCDVSQNSIEELPEDVALSAEDFGTSNHTTNVIVLIEEEGGPKGRSLTLEEATDTILFCSSIVHNLAHNAATIAIDNQDPSSDNNNSSWPLIPATPTPTPTRKSHLNEPDSHTRNTTKRSSKSQKSRHKKDTETDPTKSPNTTEGKIDQQQKTRIVGVRDNGESKKPPLLESKCNCTIM
ncbi:uncharacterized protein LOC111906265 isoform X2 [Lactuca sativa]|uniref:uncharacterized protein LOC111906265 isoform X2 n=1 Tax=Lactuca sativa TaxID=4236 RepID=UPI0022AED97A|nr:uncharacterized protein LOC111906265 isoform X2 [Lactuca sativa]